MILEICDVYRMGRYESGGSVDGFTGLRFAPSTADFQLVGMVLEIQIWSKGCHNIVLIMIGK